MPQLADFGFASRVIYPESLTKQCGTPFFVAPEILMKRPYDQSADMWSLGVIIYIVLGGVMPFLGKNRHDLFAAIVKGHYTFPQEYFDHVSGDAKDLIRSLLRVNPRERITAEQTLGSRWMVRADDMRLSENDLSKTVMELKTFNARLKLKAAIIGVMFFTRTGFLANKRYSPHGRKKCEDCDSGSDEHHSENNDGAKVSNGEQGEIKCSHSERVLMDDRELA